MFEESIAFIVQKRTGDEKKMKIRTIAGLLLIFAVLVGSTGGAAANGNDMCDCDCECDCDCDGDENKYKGEK
ncbi:MAG: hypothetical protein ABIH80_04155 [Methanobacteriota archaeon]